MLPIWLLALGFVFLLVTAPPILRRKALPPGKAKFKSLRTTSPILNTLVMVSVVGKPFLEHLKKNNWDASFLPSELATPVVVVFILSLYALLAAVLIFFFRAIRNINVLSGQRQRSPYAVWFMLIPIANVIVIPYIEYFAYQRSRALATPERASKLRATLLVGLAFGLLIASAALGLPVEAGSGPSRYDPLALLVMSFCTGCASGILTTRVINGILEAQDALAQRLFGGKLRAAATDDRKHRLEALKLNLVVVLIVVALATALFPSLPSRILGDVLSV